MGEEPSPRLHNINQERDAAELMITRLAFNRQIPMLGICRGIQTLAIALGGKVCQDIKQLVKHSQDADRTEPTHIVEIKKDSTLFNIYSPSGTILLEEQDAMSSGKASNEIVSFFKISIVFDMQR